MDPKSQTFLYNLPEPSKAIITTRDGSKLLPCGNSRPVMGRYPALIDEEGAARGVRLTAKQSFRIFELTQGLPLPIKLAVGRLAGDESFDAVTRWVGDARATSLNTVRRTDRLGPCAQPRCLAYDRGLFVVRPGGRRFDTCLGVIVNVSRFDRDRALADLLRLFLINRRENERFWTLPIVQRFVESSLAGDPSAEMDRRPLVGLAGEPCSRRWQ